ncbi:hypothetical protein DUZ99_16290 [Xylanibacillus composti]|uniref:Uncharacterized protein n=1 Tax=Xylanibacillus composti TaxID=1572762 RepID=A0A8J4M2B7_9BACL|nr:hypothetical protein [Xylanibacillus composti]MDT9726542.1 hypothetical protein [Xylanibacillus composti]GIQ68960.1 hypothetical protein XYCOK13_17840 [Xylanibacillus composti]
MEKEPNQRSGKAGHVGQVILGILLLALLHVALFILTQWWNSGFLALVFIGVVQWLYVLPTVYILRRKGRTGLMQGVLIGAGLSFLLNAACFGLFVSGALY